MSAAKKQTHWASGQARSSNLTIQLESNLRLSGRKGFLHLASSGLFFGGSLLGHLRPVCFGFYTGNSPARALTFGTQQSSSRRLRYFTEISVPAHSRPSLSALLPISSSTGIGGYFGISGPTSVERRWIRGSMLTCCSSLSFWEPLAPRWCIGGGTMLIVLKGALHFSLRNIARLTCALVRFAESFVFNLRNQAQRLRLGAWFVDWLMDLLEGIYWRNFPRFSFFPFSTPQIQIEYCDYDCTCDPDTFTQVARCSFLKYSDLCLIFSSVYRTVGGRFELNKAPRS